MTTIARLDYETRSETDLKINGIDRYVSCPSTKVLMAAWEVDDSPDFWDYTMSNSKKKELVEILRDPFIQKWAFNAQFERLVTEKVLGIKTDYTSWRCSMVLAYMLGFSGDLALVGKTLGFDPDKLKDPIGTKLINMFSKPRKPTKKDPRKWYDADTHPEEFNNFGAYCRQDVKAEAAIHKRLSNYPVLESEWDLYAIDQRINDTGVMIDDEFVHNAIYLASQRKPQIIERMQEITWLDNPGSVAQLLPWLKKGGYPFDDVRADTVKKVITEKDRNGVSDEVIEVLELRQFSAKSSIAKYDTMLNAMGLDKRFRYSLQMHGAQRTGRFAGRRLQTHNLTRTPKIIESPVDQEIVKSFINRRDLDAIDLYCGEPMNALSGMIRAALIPSPGMKFVVSDLASIESVVIGWLTGCEWFMTTLKEKRDIYMSFAAEWLKIPYSETRPHRSKAKPATLGAGFRLGGGELMPDGKKSGLWGYAENMGIIMTQKEAQASVDAFRELCPEIVDAWYALEKAVFQCLKNRMTVRWRSILFEYRKPFICIKLPSGRRLYYFKPKIVDREMTNRNGEKYVKRQFQYEGKAEGANKWGTQYSHGGKLIENIVQAIARDILVSGIIRAEQRGFKVVLHVHDEIITEVPENSQYLTVKLLQDIMSEPIEWAEGMPLGAAGWEGYFYRKD